MKRPPVLNLGLVGLTAEWETRYAPALLRLGTRAHVSGVFDPTAARAGEAAASLESQAVRGVRALLERPGMNGILLVDTGWQRSWALKQAVSAGVPLFIGQDVLRSFADWTSLPELVLASEVVVVPECLLRYQPSMLRMRELMATHLGPVDRVDFALPRARRALDSRLSLREVCNWFRTTFDVATSQVTVEANTRDAVAGQDIIADVKTRQGRSVRLHLRNVDEGTTANTSDAGSVPRPFCTITTATGRADLLGARELRWEAEGRQFSETLESDRSATDVALDLFARRALSGLIPVPDLEHLSHGQRFADLLIQEHV